MSIQRTLQCVALLVLTSSAVALAADPPGRVGRLSYMDGTVSLRVPEQEAQANAPANGDAQGSGNDWQPATVNQPLTTGHSVWTENGAKAEVQIGAAQIRMDGQTELEVEQLDDQAAHLALHQGTANIRLSAVEPNGPQIDTPRGTVTFTKPGSYRIDVDASDDQASDSLQVTTFDGAAQISGTDASTPVTNVEAGQSAKLAGTPANVVAAAAQPTDFDTWARSRDPKIVANAAPAPAAAPTVSPEVIPAPAPSATVAAAPPVVNPAPVGATVSPSLNYVSPQVTGYQDLDTYGSWSPAPSYGPVWYPTAVAADWQPYRYGHWAFVAPWGWTWIDDAPWGFAPFHYGRWVQIGHRWGWWPGQRAVRPVYAPALVAFVGGGGLSVGISIGSARPVGWVPLAPHEVYHPQYRTSATYIRNVNITTVNKTVIKNVTVVNKNVEVNKFANRGAATVVSSDAFAHGRKVNEAKISVSQKQIDAAQANGNVRRIAPAAVAAREAPHPAVRHDDIRRSSEANRTAPEASRQRPDQRSNPRTEQRNAARQATTPSATPQADRPQNAKREERRDQPNNRARDQQREQPQNRAATAAQPQAAQPNAQQQPAQEQREQQQRQQKQRDQTQDQQRQRDQAQQHQRDQAQEQQRQQQRQRDQAQAQQRRQQQDQQQQQRQRDQAQEQQRQRDQAQQRQRDQAQEQQRQREQQQREQQQQQQPDKQGAVAQPHDRQTDQARDEQRRGRHRTDG